MNKDGNVHRFAFRAIGGELLERERRKRDPQNLEREASMDHPMGRVGLTIKLDELL